MVFLLRSDCVRCPPDLVLFKLTLNHSCAFRTKHNADLFCTTGDVLTCIFMFKFKFLGSQAFGFTKIVTNAQVNKWGRENMLYLLCKCSPCWPCAGERASEGSLSGSWGTGTNFRPCRSPAAFQPNHTCLAMS